MNIAENLKMRSRFGAEVTVTQHGGIYINGIDHWTFLNATNKSLYKFLYADMNNGWFIDNKHLNKPFAIPIDMLEEDFDDGKMPEVEEEDATSSM